MFNTTAISVVSYTNNLSKATLNNSNEYWIFFIKNRLFKVLIINHLKDIQMKHS